MSDRIYSFLGLAAKAGKLISGDEACERALKAERIYLIIISEDASGNTKNKFINMCRYRNTALRVFGEKEKLGRFIGKDVRSVIAVADKNFAGHLMEMIDDRGTEYGGV